MQRNGANAEWFAQRQVRGLGDDGGRESVTIWIERRPGALWGVGRAVALEERADGAVHQDDYVFEGYEMGDAVAAANEALTSDLEISRSDGVEQQVALFTDGELKGPLERWFFGHSPTAP
jgi:hypothetical protein